MNRNMQNFNTQQINQSFKYLNPEEQTNLQFPIMLLPISQFEDSIIHYSPKFKRIQNNDQRMLNNKINFPFSKFPLLQKGAGGGACQKRNLPFHRLYLPHQYLDPRLRIRLLASLNLHNFRFCIGNKALIG
jgi:hypothetical protein